MNKNQALIELSESTRTDFGRVDFADQPEQQKVFSAIWALESQVNNGGFLQYFESWDGDTAEYAPKALRAIGAHTCASIVERAVRTASSSPLPTSQADRARFLGSLKENVRQQLEAFDQQFLTSTTSLTSCSLMSPPTPRVSVAFTSIRMVKCSRFGES
jgi:hypothetical protein